MIILPDGDPQRTNSSDKSSKINNLIPIKFLSCPNWLGFAEMWKEEFKVPVLATSELAVLILFEERPSGSMAELISPFLKTLKKYHYAGLTPSIRYNFLMFPFWSNKTHA